MAGESHDERGAKAQNQHRARVFVSNTSHDEQGGSVEKQNRIDVFLDDGAEAIVSYLPPVRFELDSSQLEDGPHTLRIEAYDSSGSKGVRTIPFTVRNGPGIAVHGLSPNEVLEGTTPILVNAYGGAGEHYWEPSRAETPAPIPTWAWVLFIFIVAYGVFYGVQQWNPPAAFAETPSFGPIIGPITVADQGTPPDTPAASSPAPADAELGASVYSNNCASCHQASGEGLPGTFPPLAGDPVATAEDPGEHIATVLNGKQGSTIDGVTYSSPMPAFAAQLSDAEIAAVINHERTSWGNSAPTVTPEDVTEAR